MDDTLFKNHSLDKLSIDPNGVQYRSEVIANMKRVINSRNYVWIVTANNTYTKDNFTTKFFGPDKEFFDKSEYYFLFMNPADMGKVYEGAKNDASLPASDKAKLDYKDGWVGYEDIHKKGLKPYAIYAQSLVTRSEYNKKLTPKIGDFKIYLFDDKSGDEIKNNSAKFGIYLIRVTDFNTTPPILNLLKDFTKVLDNGTSKIGSAKPLVIPTEYTDENVKQALMADNADLPKCEADVYDNKPDFINPPTHIPNNMIGDTSGNSAVISNNLEICTNGDSKCGIPPPTSYSTDTDITKWTASSNDIYSDHEPIKYNYVIGEDTNVVTCANGNTENTDVNTSFITWNIAYKMIHTDKFYLSKFYCSQSANPKACIEEDKIYEKRMQNILTAIDTIMKNKYNKNTNYVFLQECTNTLLDVVAKDENFKKEFEIFKKDKNEFGLILRKSALSVGDITIFDFGQNNDGSLAMSNYISKQFYSYDIEVNTPDLKRVMCYIVKSTTTIFFNVHFGFNDKAPYIFQRQAELYNFMNAIVYSIRSIPEGNELHEYQNYDIVFTGDFNVNMLQRFPQDIKHFGYPDGNMIPIFFTCNYIKGQKTIISTTYNNLPTARATNADTANYNLTNIDFSIFYPRIGDAGTKPIKVEPQTPMPTKKALPTGSGSSAPGSSGKSTSTPKPPTPTPTPATTLKVMSFNTWFEAFNPNGGTNYCNVKNASGNLENECQKNIIGEILDKMNKGFQVIFLQEFTSRIQEVFKGFPVTFSDTKDSSVNDDTSISASDKKPPFMMTYTLPGGGSPLEYFVYTFRAGPESITKGSKVIKLGSEVSTTLCSKSFFDNKPADKYFMGNLVSIPNDPLYASDGKTTPYGEWTTGNWLIGGSRPYIVLVFHYKKMILINIHAPHDHKHFENKPFHLLEQEQKINKVNADEATSNLMKYAVKELGNLLRNRIPNELKNYSVIIGGDFNTRPDRAREYLVMLGADFFSSDSKTFSPTANNLLTDNNRKINTCCITNPGGSFTSPYDQIYSNKLNILKYETYDAENLKRTPNGKSVYFSDHLPVYAEIEIPASGTFAPSTSSGGSKRFTLRNNNNNNNSNNNNSKSTSRKIRKSVSASMPTTRFTKKKRHSMHKHKTRRHKH